MIAIDMWTDFKLVCVGVIYVIEYGIKLTLIETAV